MASVKGNIILNALNTVSGIVFPMITFPYAARVLMPDGIGTINFLNSIVNYLVMLTALGIPIYAVREVAKCREDKAQRDQLAVEVITLSFALCLIGYAGVWALAQFVPEIHRSAPLFYVLSLAIIFNAVGVNWFYQGIEDFKFITIRAVIVRTLAALALFVFVKDEGDLLTYGIILVGSTVGNNVINFVHLRKHISLSLVDLRRLRVVRHVKPALQVFGLLLVISLYVYLNSILLGFMADEEQVGYFTAGTKIAHIALAMVTSVGTVLLPRCSSLLKNGDKAGFEAIIKKSLNLTLALTLPMTAGLMILAEPVTLVFCGEEFAKAVPVLFINAPVLLFVGLANVTSNQVLYPMDKIRLVLVSVLGGAAVNILICLLLIPRYGAVGATVGATVVELAVLLVQLIGGKKYYPFKYSDLFVPRYVVSTIVMSALVLVCLSLLPPHNVLKVTVCSSVGAISYFAMLVGMKDPMLAEMAQNLKKKFKCN